MSYKAGKWNVVCDVCGFEYYNDQLKKRWDGLMVCEADWEPRHPQDFVKGVPDDQAPPWSRPDEVKNFDIAPTILSQSSNTTGTFGQPLFLSVTVDSAAPISVVWTQDGQTITNNDTASNPILVIPNFTSRNTGTYVATVTNNIGSTQSTPILISSVADTWNPAKLGSQAVLTNGNRTINAQLNFCRGFSTGTKTSGKVYFEILVGPQFNTFGYIGVAPSTAESTTGNIPSPAVLQRGAGAWSEVGGVNGAAWTNGDVVGFAYDIPNKTMLTYKNNVPLGSITVPLMPTSVQIFAGNTWGGSGTFEFTIRTNAAQFSYTPPTGYTAWAG